MIEPDREAKPEDFIPDPDRYYFRNDIVSEMILFLDGGKTEQK